MHRSRLLTLLSAMLMMILAVYSIVDGQDWCFFALEVVSLIVLLVPSIKRMPYRYCDTMLMLSLFAQVAMTVMVCIHIASPSFLSQEFWMIPVHSYILITFQTMQAFVIGLMAMMLTYRDGFEISKRWIILMAMFVALAYGVVYMFGSFIGMYLSGQEVMNALGGYAAQELNANMMSVPFVGTFASAALAVIVTRIFRDKSVEDMLTAGDA